MSNAAGGPIKVFVLGDARIETPVGVIEPTAEVVFATALYLLLEGGSSRRTLEKILWPSVAPQTASHRLRQTLLKLRRLGVPLSNTRNGRIHFACEVAIDADALRPPENLDAFVSQPTLAPLFGYEPTFSAAFADWVDRKRLQFQAPIIELFLSVLAECRSQGEWIKTERVATRLLELAPFNEEGTLALAESYAMRGSKLEGLQILDRYLAELGPNSLGIGLPAAVMRKRIAERLPRKGGIDTYRPPFVGRGEAMSALNALIPRVREAKGGACHISGDAGIGKSRLLNEFSNFAALRGLATVRATCRAHDRHRPLSVFVDLVPVLRGLRGAIGCSPDTLRYLDRLTLHQSEAPTSTGPSDADFVYARVQRAVFDLLDAVSDERPLLILIEDVQGLDEVSANLFADLIPWVTQRPILFAFSSREHPKPWLSHSEGYLFGLSLPPLQEDAAKELVLAIVSLNGGALSDPDQTWCLKSAEGNPYFLAELATHLLETGGRHAAPPSLSTVINQRLERLGPATLQLLQTCALLDKNCSMERVEQVLGYEHHQLLQSINELGALGMLVLESGGESGSSVGRLALRHELLAVAAENTLTPPGQAYLHRRIGQVLESEIADNRSTSILWDCAKHWQRAGNVGRAFSLARSCAMHLMKVGLCSAAAEAYRMSMPFCSSDSERIDMLKGEAAAHFGASDWVNLANTTETVRRLQAYIEPENDGHDDIELMALRALWQNGELNTVREKALGCLQCATATHSHRVRAGVMSLMLLDLACDQDAMTRTFGFLEPLFESPTIDPGLLHEAQMVYQAACGDLAQAVLHAQLLIECSRRSENVADLTRALANGSVAARTAGRIDLAKEWLHEALSIYESHKLPLATIVPMQILASIALDENDLASARAWHRRLGVFPETIADSAAVRQSIGLRIALCERNVQEVRRLAYGDMDQLRSDTNPHRRIYATALLVAVQIAEQKKPDADLLKLLETSHLVARRNTRQAFATFVLVTALRRSGKTKRAQRLLDEYCTRYRREPTPPPYHVLELLESFASAS